jgi:hypothetical protein
MVPRYIYSYIHIGLVFICMCICNVHVYVHIHIHVCVCVRACVYAAGARGPSCRHAAANTLWMRSGDD